MIKASLATTDEDLEQILSLQSINLKQNLDESTRKDQGFVTMKFNMEMLRALRNLHPSIVLKNENQIIAYAIVVLIEGAPFYPAIQPLLKELEALSWNNLPVRNMNFYIMGQVCVDRDYRGSGAFDLLYQTHQEYLSNQFDCVITEISSSNTRSLRAHERIGFTRLASYRDQIDEWQIVGWDWKP